MVYVVHFVVFFFDSHPFLSSLGMPIPVSWNCQLLHLINVYQGRAKSQVYSSPSEEPQTQQNYGYSSILAPHEAIPLVSHFVLQSIRSKSLEGERPSNECKQATVSCIPMLLLGIDEPADTGNLGYCS